MRWCKTLCHNGLVTSEGVLDYTGPPRRRGFEQVVVVQKIVPDRRIQSLNLGHTLRCLIMICSVLMNCTKMNHKVGHGAESADLAIQNFLQAYLSKDYLTVRELIHYNRPCLGYMGTALNRDDPIALQAYLDDHPGSFPDQKSLIAVIDKNMLDMSSNELIRDILINRGELKMVSPDNYHYTYPAFKTDKDRKLIGFDDKESNVIEVVKNNGRWYILNPQCHAFSYRREIRE